MAAAQMRFLSFTESTELFFFFIARRSVVTNVSGFQAHMVAVQSLVLIIPTRSTVFFNDSHYSKKHPSAQTP